MSTELVDTIKEWQWKYLDHISPQNNLDFISLQEQITGIQKYSEGRVIKSAEDVVPATDDLVLIAHVSLAVEVLRKSYVGPLNDRVKFINATFRTLTDPLDEANDVTRRKIATYRADVERQRKEAEEINRLRMEAARREAALSGTGEISESVDLVEVRAAPAAHVRTSTGTLGTMMVRKWEIVDIGLVPRDYLIVDAARIGKVVRAGIPAIPGIKIWSEETLSVRGQK
jgi:hypothetical protein